METLHSKEWKPIPIAEKFNSFEAGKSKGLNHLTQTNEGGIPYISATNRNNGTSCFIEEDCYSSRLLQKGNCIGFIKNGDGAAGYAIYKQEPFVATSDVLFGYSDWLSPSKGLFFVACQDKIENKYSHGYKRNRQHLSGDKVMLPVNENGEPDYDFMEHYVSEKIDALLERYKAFLKKQLAELSHMDVPALNEKEWKPIEAFGEGAPFKIKTTSSSIDGINLINNGDAQTIPYITRTDSNNGISRFVSTVNMEKGYDEAGCISVGLDTQTAFFQSYDFVTGQNIQIVTSEHLNKYSAMFLVPIFKQQMVAKFNWGGNGATLSRMKKLQIMLPTTDTGETDWDYMEQYAKNLMLKKYQQYLEFLEGQQAKVKN